MNIRGTHTATFATTNRTFQICLCAICFIISVLRPWCRFHITFVIGTMSPLSTDLPQSSGFPLLSLNIRAHAVIFNVLFVISPAVVLLSLGDLLFNRLDFQYQLLSVSQSLFDHHTTILFQWSQYLDSGQIQHVLRDQFQPINLSYRQKKQHPDHSYPLPRLPVSCQTI